MDQICAIDPENEKSCIKRLRKCEEFPYPSCENYNFYNYYLDGEKCVQKKDKTGCELISCTKTAINECENFIPQLPDEKCTLNAAGNKCEIQKCSEQDENNCSSFIPNDKSKKCVNFGENCGLECKECDDFSANECYYYDRESLEDGTNPNSCIPNSNNDGCELKHCEDLNSNECSKFKPIYNGGDFQCISRGTDCQLVQCQNLANTECNKFITNDLAFTCIPEGTGCFLRRKLCSEMPVSFCKYQIVDGNGDYCLLNDEGTRCIKIQNPNQNPGNNEGSNGSTNSNDSEKEKEPEKDSGNDSKNDSKNSSKFLEYFNLKFLFLFML